jgi:hypothetical protein
MSQTRKVNDWIAHVDEWAGFADDTVVVRIIEKPKGTRVIGLYKPDGTVEQVPHQVGAELPRKEGFEWRIPKDAIPALCAALQEQNPATERLTTKLEQLLEREAGRVDTLIEKTSSPVVVTHHGGVVNQGGAPS